MPKKLKLDDKKAERKLNTLAKKVQAPMDKIPKLAKKADGSLAALRALLKKEKIKVKGI